MYEKDGEKYFVVDSHMHYWDASPENWKNHDHRAQPQALRVISHALRMVAGAHRDHAPCALSRA